MNMLFLLILIGYFVYQIKTRRSQPANSSYTKTKNGDWTEFVVEPGRETHRAAIILPAIGSFLAALYLTLSPPQHLSAGFATFFIVVTAICVWFLFLPIRPKSQRTASRFRVSPTGIDANGQQFSAEDIHRFVIKNAVDTNFIIAGRTAKSEAIQADHARDRMRASNMAYYLNLEEGGRDHMLAGGMNETTANGLMTDVGKIIGFNESD